MQQTCRIDIVTQAAGTSKHCVLAKLLERHAKSDGSYEDEDTIKEAMAGLYLGVFHFPNKSLCAESVYSGCRDGSPLCLLFITFPL